MDPVTKQVALSRLIKFLLYTRRPKVTCVFNARSRAVSVLLRLHVCS
jgi:hypothetical protein